MQHSFDVEIAKKYGINCAVILNNLYFWVEKNRTNKRHFHDGRYWTYNSKKAFAELLPYLTTKQIDYSISKLIDKGLIITGNYNKIPYDRTLWYAITDFGFSILQNCQMEKPKMENGYPENVKPIPDINTDIKTNINNTSKVAPVQPQTILDMFNEICKSYSRATKLSESRRKAIKARLKMYSIDDFKQLFEMAEGSSFLKGGNNHNWSANFDWLIKDANMAKVLDGNYSDAGEKQQEEPERRKKEPVSEGFRAIYERNMRRKEMEERGEIPEEPFDPTRLPFQ